MPKFGTFNSFLDDKAEIECTVHVDLPSLFKPIQKSRQQALRSYCITIYTVVTCHIFHVNQIKARMIRTFTMSNTIIAWYSPSSIYSWVILYKALLSFTLSGSIVVAIKNYLLEF